MKKRTCRFGWTKQLQRAEHAIKASARHQNIYNPDHAASIAATGELMRRLELTHLVRVTRLRGG